MSIKTVALARGRSCAGCGAGVEYVIVVENTKRNGQLMALCDRCQGHLIDHRDSLESFIGKLLGR